MMREVNRDAVAAGEGKLVSCAADQSTYCSICTIALGPCGDLHFTSWGHWKYFRGGADVGLNSCCEVCGCGTEYRCEALTGETCDDMFMAMARIALSKPNEAMARIAPRRNGTISLDPNFRVEIPKRVSLD